MKRTPKRSGGSLPWVRLPTDDLDDPTLAALSDSAWRTYHQLLQVAARNGGSKSTRADVERVAWTVRRDVQIVRADIEMLKGVQLVQIDARGHVVLLRWDTRHFFKSDRSNERVRRHRRGTEDGVDQRNVTGNVTPADTGNGTVTASEREVEVEREAEKNGTSDPSSPPPDTNQSSSRSSATKPKSADRRKSEETPGSQRQRTQQNSRGPQHARELLAIAGKQET